MLTNSPVLHKAITTSDVSLGRQLTADVAVLALTMPVVTRDALPQLVLPFVFVIALALVVLFATPFRDVPFIAQHATAELASFRFLILLIAAANILFPGYATIELLTGRWLIATGCAVLGVAVLTIDLRRVFPS